MRVLRVISTLETTRGGPSLAARATARALARAGLDVVQITTVAPRAAPHGPGEETVDGVMFRYFPRSIPGTFHFSRSIGEFLRSAAREFDVMHIEALFQYPTVVACRAAMQHRIPYVLAPLGSLNDWSIRHRAWKKVPYFRLVEVTHLENAAALHANSPAEAEALTAEGFGSKVHLIPLGVDVPADLGVERRLDGPVQLLFLSRLHPVKGLPLLLEALAAVRARGLAVELTIAGTGEQAYERELRDHVQRLALGDVVRFVGHVEGAAKERLLRGAHAFALTSYQESFGLAVAEAMAYRLPVLITDRVGIERDVSEAGAGYVVPPEVGAITDSLAALVSDPRRGAEMGARGARLVGAEYSWDSVARQLVELFESVAVRRPVRALAGRVPA